MWFESYQLIVVIALIVFATRAFYLGKQEQLMGAFGAIATILLVHLLIY